MSSQKCSDCGLVNWADATFCKRCNAALQNLNEAGGFGPPTQPRLQSEKPASMMIRRYPVLAGLLIVLSCVLVIGTFAAIGMLRRHSRVSWRSFRPEQTFFTVQMPSEPIVRDPIVSQHGPYMLTKRIYESRITGQGAAVYIIVNYMPAIPTDRVSYEEMLEAELNAAAAVTSSTVVSKQSITVSRYKGLEAELKPPANLALKSPKTFIKLFMNSDQLYVMQITATQKSELLAGKDIFLTPQFSY